MKNTIFSDWTGLGSGKSNWTGLGSGKTGLKGCRSCTQSHTHTHTHTHTHIFSVLAHTKLVFQWDIFYVCSMYLPFESLYYQKQVTTDCFSRLEDEILKYNSLVKIILCGDLNAITGTEPDFIMNAKNILDLTSAHFPNTDSSVHQSPRCSKDQTVPNSNGKRFIEL